MPTKSLVLLVVVLLLGVVMFAYIHSHTKAAVTKATATVQAQCIQGDRKADKDAADAQHQADMASLADVRQQLRAAQKEASQVQSAADQAAARAASLEAALTHLKQSDASVQAWANTPIPASLQEQMKGR